MRLIDADELQIKIASLSRLARSDEQKSLMGRVLYIIDQMPTLTVPQWIRMEERLPGWSGDYICVSRDKNGREWVIPAEWSREMKTWFGRFGEIKNKVTHWMPLPEPPEEDVQ